MNLWEDTFKRTLLDVFFIAWTQVHDSLILKTEDYLNSN